MGSHQVSLTVLQHQLFCVTAARLRSMSLLSHLLKLSFTLSLAQHHLSSRLRLSCSPLQVSLAVILPPPCPPPRADAPPGKATTQPAPERPAPEPHATSAAHALQLVRTLLQCAGSTHREVAAAAASCLASIHVLWLAQGSGRPREQGVLHMPRLLASMPAVLLRRAARGFLAQLAAHVHDMKPGRTSYMALWAFWGRECCG